MNGRRELTSPQMLEGISPSRGNSLSRNEGGPRICMASTRKFKKRAFHCGHYEAQDILAATSDLDLICLEPAWGYEFKERWQRRLLYRDLSKRLIFQNPGLHKVRLNREYDLFIAQCQTYKDLLTINAIEGWKDHCRTSVCWIDEIWAAAIPLYKHWLHALQRFDHVFIGASGSIGALSNAIARPCRWLPGAVDALRFSPFPNPPARVIDVHSMGRRSEGIHRALLRGAERRQIFYLYDTFPGSLTAVFDHKQHRDLFANVAKRSRYFVVAPGKIGESDETQGQVEVGYRYFEGAAAGAVMIGEVPICSVFEKLFPASDAVIQIRPDGSDVMEVLARLASEPGWVSAMSRRNAAEALLRHDWIYRWKEIFSVSDVKLSAGMVERERRLKELAELAASPAEDRAMAKSW